MLTGETLKSQSMSRESKRSEDQNEQIPTQAAAN